MFSPNMECCLLCLCSENMMLGSITIDSVQWKTDNVKYIMEKHFWPVDTVNYSYAMCLCCWRELEKFHKFYLLIETAHANLGGTITISRDANEGKENTSNSYEQLKSVEGSYGIAIDEKKTPTENARDSEKSLIIEPEPEYTLLDEDAGKLRRKRGRPSNLRQNTNDTLMKFYGPKSLAKDKQLRKDCKIAIGTTFKSNEKIKCIIENDTMTVENANVSNNALDGENTSLADTKHQFNKDKQLYGTFKKKRKNPDKKTREEHDKMIAEHLKISCCLCNVTLENFIALRKHFREEHKKRGFMMCCKKKFFNRPMLVDHLNFHLDPNYFKCKFCAKVYSDRCTLDKHGKIHMEPDQARGHNCIECGKSFVENKQLQKHKITHAADYKKNYSCSECGKFFSTLYNLNYHIKAIHHNKYAKFCDICGKTIRNSFKLHMEKHNKTLTTPVHCDVCGLRLIDKRSLKQHKNSQHPVGGKMDHSCHICLKVSTSLRGLRAHIRFAHEIGYTHKCTLCGKAFKKPEVLKEHMATHTGTPLYYCPWCPKSFKSNGNMYNHRKNVHPKEWKELKCQKYIDKGLKEKF